LSRLVWIREKEDERKEVAGLQFASGDGNKRMFSGRRRASTGRGKGSGRKGKFCRGLVSIG